MAELSHAISEGVASAKAMAADIVLLMWLRTVMNHQYRYGGSMPQTFMSLWRQGGVPRLYSGVTAAMLEGPLGRGVGAFANDISLTWFDALDHSLRRRADASSGRAGMSSNGDGGVSRVPIVAKTAVSSLAVGVFRLVYYPLDTLKTMLQVEGSHGAAMIREKVRKNGLGVLYHGSLSHVAGVTLRHTTWFTVYNYLNQAYPEDHSEGASPLDRHLRNAAVGAASAVVTDIAGNPLAAAKAYRQTSARPIPYTQLARDVVREFGVVNLLTRGLSTRLWVDVLNSAIFTVIWRHLAPQ